MDDNEIRNQLFQFFRKLIEDKRNTSNVYATQYVDIKSHFHRLLHPDRLDIESPTYIKAREILSEWINNNLLMIGNGESHNHNYLTLTEYGRKCIEEENILPYDP